MEIGLMQLIYANMTLTEIFKLAVGDNKEAYDFIIKWHDLVNRIDNVIDGDVDMLPIDRAHVFVDLCNFLYCPYFIRHALQLWPILSKINADYLVSIENENVREPKQYFLYDYLRQSYIDLTLVVAHIEGNFENLVKINRELRSLSYDHDH